MEGRGGGVVLLGDQRNGPLRLGCERLFDEGKDGYEATPGGDKKQRAGVVRGVEGKTACRGQGEQGIAGVDVIEHIAGYLAIGNAFDGDSREGGDARSGGERVAAAELPAVEAEEAGKKLSGLIDKGLVIGTFQGKGFCIPGLLPDGHYPERQCYHNDKLR